MIELVMLWRSVRPRASGCFSTATGGLFYQIYSLMQSLVQHSCRIGLFCLPQLTPLIYTPRPERLLGQGKHRLGNDRISAFLGIFPQSEAPIDDLDLARRLHLDPLHIPVVILVRPLNALVETDSILWMD